MSEGICQATHKDILRYEELTRIARIAVRLRFRKIRLTSEPLTRRDIAFLIPSIKNIEVKGWGKPYILTVRLESCIEIRVKNCPAALPD